MPDERNNRPKWEIKDFAKVFIDTVKEIRISGREISIDTISENLSNRDEIKDLISLINKKDYKKARVVSDTDDKYFENKLEKIEEDRNRLFKKVIESEKNADNERDFQKQLAITLINYIRSENNEELQASLDDLKKYVLENSDIENREKSLYNLKNQLLKVDIGNKESNRKNFYTPKLFKNFLTLTDNKLMEQIKNASLDALFTLRGMLGEEFTNIIENVEKRINQSSDIEYLLSQRAIVLEIIEDYAEQIETEKERVTQFIKEIGKKLSDLEKTLEVTNEADEEFRRDNFSFSQNLENEIKDVSESIRYTNDFEGLKNLVTSRLEKISETLTKKRKEYIILLEKSGKERTKLTKNFGDMIIELKEQNRILSEQIRKDPLTGIFNRKVFEEKMAMELDRFQRYKKSFSMMFFDVDYFKDVNDKYGHQAGDRALRGIAARAEEALRKTDILARYGGEEFVVILPETPLPHALKAAKKVHKLIKDTDFDYEGEIVKITVSIGVTEVRDTDENISSIITRADSLMYEAKKKGRNSIVSDIDVAAC